MAFATAAGESEPLLRGIPSEREVTPSERRSKMFRYAAPLFAAAVALGVLARADPLNVLATSKEGDAWVYNNPAMWLPKWGASIAPTPGIVNTRATFVVRTFCKTDALKLNYADFWVDGEKEAYVVHHDYGSTSFFDSGNGIKMERVVINATTGERGYRVETDAVDFEYGFAMKNLKTGAWLYEIGKGSEAMLYNEPCVQQYGSYFNRVRTIEPDPNDITYVFGTCDARCGDDYLDSANQLRFNTGAIPNAPGELIVGRSNDARLFTLHSAVLGTWIRSSAARDTQFAESDSEARHIIAHVDAYGPDLRWSAGAAYLLMAQIKVTRKANNDIALSVVSTKYHNWGAQCTTSGCSAAVYDLTEMWYKSDTTAWAKSDGSPARQLSAPLFTLGEKGDTRVGFHEIKFPDDAYLTETTLFEPNSWGTDLDVRRISPVSGAIAGRMWWQGKSIRNYHPMADETSPSNENEKTWIWAVLGGGGCGRSGSQMSAVCVTMTKMKVFLASDGSVKVRNMGSKKDIGITAEYVAANPNNLDVIKLKMPIGALYNQAPITVTTATRASSGDVGISGMKYVLAPEMVPSLAGMDVVGLEPESSAASLGQSSSGSLGQSSASGLAYDFPHHFNHEYPGTSGCEATCEGDSVTSDQCASMFYCEWYQDKCWSSVGSTPCPATEAQLDEYLNDNQRDMPLEDPVACTVECEYESETECAADPICAWTGGSCFSKFSEPCPI